MMSLIEDIFIISKDALTVIVFTQRSRSSDLKQRLLQQKIDCKSAKVFDRLKPQRLLIHTMPPFYTLLVTKL